MNIQRAENVYTQSGAGAVQRLVGDRVKETVSVKDFGAVGDGSVDDTAAIQAAADSLVATGGCIVFPRGLYKITDTITVSSERPIRLVGDMFGHIFDTQTTTSAIILGDDIAGPMIHYVAPNPAERAMSGGGEISGLVFTDVTPTGRTYTCTAVLDLEDFICSSVHHCTIQHIKGRAVKGGFMIMSEFSNNVVRYCGDTSLPAIDLSTDVSFPAQSFQILGNRIEVCYGDTYLKIPAGNIDVSVIDNRFEADTAVADTNQQFINTAAFYGKYIGNTFNRSTATHVTCSGAGNTFSANTFRTIAVSTTGFALTGGRNTVNGNVFESTRTGYEIEVAGPNVIEGNTFYFSGAILVTSGSVTITGNAFHQLTATSAVLSNNFWIDAGTTQNNTITGNRLNNVGGAVTDVGGIRVAAAYNVVSGNSLRGFSGSGDGAIGIRVESSTAVVTGNSCEDAPITANTIRFICEGNDSNQSLLPIEKTSTYNPPNIVDGSFATEAVSWTGIVAGDMVDVQFDGLIAGFHLEAISGTNQVAVTFFNESGGDVDLSSGTIKLRLRRR